MPHRRAPISTTYMVLEYSYASWEKARKCEVHPSICRGARAPPSKLPRFVQHLQHSMSYLEQRRLVGYKKQLVLLQERMQRYSRTGEPVPALSTWKHRFEDTDEEDAGGDEAADVNDAADDDDHDIGGGVSTAHAILGSSVVGPTHASVGGHGFNTDDDVAARNDALIAEMGLPAGNGDDSTRRASNGRSHADGVPELPKLADFDYLEAVEEAGVILGDTPASLQAEVATVRRPSTAGTNYAQARGATMSQGGGGGGGRKLQPQPRKNQRHQQHQQRRDRRQDQRQLCGPDPPRLPSQPVPHRSRFEEPGSVFYRSDDVWDSAGIDHDQMRRPYRRLQFSTKGDYPVRKHTRAHALTTRRLGWLSMRGHCSPWCCRA
jgi:hypothetical protein